MSSTLRAVAVASCTALLVTGTVALAGSSSASPKPAFSVTPTFGQVASTVTLTSPTTAFTKTETVTFGAASSTDTKLVSKHRLTAVVPAGATSGAVTVSDGTTTTTGSTFTVQMATRGTSSLSHHRLTYAHPVVVTGAETAAGSPLAGQPAALQHRAAGSKQWRHAKGTSVRHTDKKGAVHWKVTPSANGRYRVYFRQSRTFAAATTKSSCASCRG